MPRRGPRDQCRQSGKAKFTTWDSAAAHAHRLDGNDAYAYYCKSCGHYHVTGEPRRGRGHK